VAVNARRVARTAPALLLALAAPWAAALAQDAKVTPLLGRDLGGIAGKEGVLFLVEYPPGGSTVQHRHDADVFVYVLEGSVVMGVQGQAPVTLGLGQTFHEGPGDVHAVSRNASDTAPAKFLAFFVKGKGAPVLVPVP
jgi:quercetin dioxygenase-like cupin family protein